MKRILSLILVVAMLFVMAPAVYAANDVEFLFDKTEYTAKVGETITVKVLATAETTIGQYGGSLDIKHSSMDGLTSVVTGGKIVASDVNFLKSDTTVNRAVWSDENWKVVAGEENVLFTIEYTSTKAGTYTLTFPEAVVTNDETFELWTYGTTGCTLTFTSDAPAVKEDCIFKQNSTYVAGEDFNYPTVAANGTELFTAIANGEVTGFTKDENSTDGRYQSNGGTLTCVEAGSTAYVKENVLGAGEGEYALEVNHDKTASASEYMSCNTTKTLDADCTNADYILFSFKNVFGGSYVRMYVYGSYTNTNGATTSNKELISYIFKSNSIGNEGTTIASYSPSKTAWTSYDCVMNTKTWIGDLYANHEYIGQINLKERSCSSVDTSSNQISGINSIKFRHDRSGATGTFYLDDIQVRTMTTAQYNAMFANDTIDFDKTTLSTADVLPTMTTGMGAAITWTSSDSNVTIGADGSVALADGISSATGVTLTATYAGMTKTYENITVVNVLKYASYVVGDGSDYTYTNVDGYTGIVSGSNDATLSTFTKDGITFRNAFTDYGTPVTFYYKSKTNVVNNNDAVNITKEEYDALDTTTDSTWKYKYTYDCQYFANGVTSDSAISRAVVDGTPAIVSGMQAIRLDSRYGRQRTAENLVFNVTPAGFTASNNNLIIEVDYIDKGGNGEDSMINIQYRTASSTTNTATLTGVIGDTGAIKTATIELTDADFSKDSGTGFYDQAQDFRFYSNKGQAIYFTGIRVYQPGYDVTNAPAATTPVAVQSADYVLNLDGSLTVTETFTPNATDSAATLYVAIYDADGNLAGVSKSAETAVTENVETTITTVDAIGTYDYRYCTVKAFVWNADLTPLK